MRGRPVPRTKMTTESGRPHRTKCFAPAPETAIFKIKVSGRSSGKSCLRGPVWGLRALVCARVLPGQRA
jgi:hypothetical protein